MPSLKPLEEYRDRMIMGDEIVDERKRIEARMRAMDERFHKNEPVIPFLMKVAMTIFLLGLGILSERSSLQGGEIILVVTSMLTGFVWFVGK